MGSPNAPGTLYLVATPIGNLGDLSSRAIEVLRSVDRVLCEDTRRTGRLLSQLGITARLQSFHEHNERAAVSGVVNGLSAGESMALVSDAGTPGVSDPGYRLVSAAAGAGIPVVPIPGPSAVLAALTASGLPTDRFCFVGYLPPRAARRRSLLEEMKTLRATLVFFEAPHRIEKTLVVLLDALGDREAALCRELTKIHEEIVRGRLGKLLERVRGQRIRGEITLVVHGFREPEPDASPQAFRGQAREHYERLLAAGTPPEEAARQTRELFGP